MAQLNHLRIMQGTIAPSSLDITMKATHTFESAISALRASKRTFSVTFEKKDGTLRTANGSFQLPPAKGNGNAGIDAMKAQGYVFAIDRNKQRKGLSGFISFLPERTIRIKSGKVHFQA